jgi:membrane-bound serine protease (ClpP class)
MVDAGILATVLLLVGLFLLGLEFFIPSFGMILILAVISLIVSLWSAVQAWWGTQPGFFWTYIFALVGGIPSSLAVALVVLQKTAAGNRLVLQPPVDEPVPDETQQWMGRTGRAATLMTPGGLVLIDGQRLHAESLGMMVEPGTPVIVVGTAFNRVIVRPVQPGENSTDAPVQDRGALDFDVPPG